METTTASITSTTGLVECDPPESGVEPQPKALHLQTEFSQHKEDDSQRIDHPENVKVVRYRHAPRFENEALQLGAR